METLFELTSSVNMPHIVLVILSMLGIIVMSLLMIDMKTSYFTGRAGKSRRRRRKDKGPKKEE